jgi:hypothetical protein
MRPSAKPRCNYKVPAYGGGNFYRCHRAAEEGQQYCWQHARKMAKEAEQEISTKEKDSK